MDTKDSRLVINHRDDIHHVGFLDRNLLEEVHIHMIGVEIGRLVEEAAQPKIVISFKNVEHLSSAALGALITINNKIREKEGQLRLADIDARVYEIFLITKLNTLFKIYENTEQAIKSFE